MLVSFRSNIMSVWTTERKEIATWLSGYLAMIKKWVDKILDNEDHDVDKMKIITQIDEWIKWLEETKIKIIKMKFTYIIEILGASPAINFYKTYILYIHHFLKAIYLIGIFEIPSPLFLRGTCLVP